MKKIKIKDGVFTVIDDEFFYLKEKFPCWYLDGNGYVLCERYIKTEYGNVRERRLLHWLIARPMANYFVDHINRDKLDNRKSNLRWATKSQNASNSKKSIAGKNKYRGVSRSHVKSKPFRAYLRHNYKQLIIGYFKTEIEAAKAYDKKALELRGEFAALNFPA